MSGVGSSSVASARAPGGAGGAWMGTRRRVPGRRSVPHLVVGVLLVVVCTTGAVWAWVSASGRVPVLALAHPVTAGQTLAAEDLREVGVAADSGVATVPAEQAGALVGRSMAVSAPAGTLLGPAMVGAAPVAGVGQAIVALVVGASALPAEVGTGARVAVVAVQAPGLASAPRGGGGWVGTVVSVTVASDGQSDVVSVAMAELAAREVAALPREGVAVVLLGPGER